MIKAADKSNESFILIRMHPVVVYNDLQMYIQIVMPFLWNSGENLTRQELSDICFEYQKKHHILFLKPFFAFKNAVEEKNLFSPEHIVNLHITELVVLMKQIFITASDSQLMNFASAFKNFIVMSNNDEFSDAVFGETTSFLEEIKYDENELLLATIEAYRDDRKEGFGDQIKEYAYISSSELASFVHFFTCSHPYNKITNLFMPMYLKMVIDMMTGNYVYADINSLMSEVSWRSPLGLYRVIG